MTRTHDQKLDFETLFDALLMIVAALGAWARVRLLRLGDALRQAPEVVEKVASYFQFFAELAVAHPAVAAFVRRKRRVWRHRQELDRLDPQQFRHEPVKVATPDRVAVRYEKRAA